MRFITIPESIVIRNPRTKEELPGDPKSFLDYAYDVWFNDPRASEGGPMKLRRWQKMVDVFDKYSKPGDVVVLEDSDWEQLKKIINEPKASYPPLVGSQLVAFSSAVLDAVDVDPRPSKVEDKVEEKVESTNSTAKAE